MNITSLSARDNLRRSVATYRHNPALAYPHSVFFAICNDGFKSEKLNSAPYGEQADTMKQKLFEIRGAGQ